MAYLPLFLLILVALGAGATTLSLIISIRASREARATFFPIVREEEGQRAIRARVASLFFVAVTALAFGGWLATERGLPLPTTAGPPPAATATEALAQAVSPPATDTAAASPTERATARPARTFTPRPAATATALASSPTLSPAPTSVQLVTETVVFTGTGGISVTVTAAPVTGTTSLVTPEPAATEAEVILEPPPPEAEIGPIAFALDITDRREAIDPSEVFTAPVETIYATFPYRGLRNGLAFAAVWYHNDREFLRDEGEWQWGSTDRSYVFARLIGQGVYTLELWLNNEMLASGTFEVN
ncbi:MAG: hypothetical protein ACE5H9_11600 [Anaerolineae bacterium]